MSILNYNPDSSVRLVLDRGRRWLWWWPGDRDPNARGAGTENSLSGLPTSGMGGPVGASDLSGLGPLGSGPGSGSTGRQSTDRHNPDTGTDRFRESREPRDIRDLPFRLDDTDLRRNLRSLDAHITDDHYRRSFGTGDWALEGTAVLVGTGAGIMVPSLPNDGTISGISSTFVRPSEWVAGRVKIRIWYSSPVASNKIFRVVPQVFATKTGAVLLTNTTINSTNLDLGGPATAADTVLSSEIFSTGATITSDMELFSVRVARVSADAADTNPNALHIYAVRIEHVSSVREG